jgi:hypothetical protein
MTDRPVYIIDASSLIDLEELVPKDFFQPLFKSLESFIKSGTLISHEEVFKELKGKDGQIFFWAKNQKDFFVSIDGEQIEKATEILAKFPKLIDHNKPGGADPFLIAYGKIAENQPKLMKAKYIIVAEEKSSGNANKPSIPDVCKFYNLDCISLNDFLNRELKIEITMKNNTTK